MKRLGNIWDKVVDKENLRKAMHKASLGKRHRYYIGNVLSEADKYIDKLHDILVSGKYRTSKYILKTIFEPKQRTIYCLPFFPDRIVHHALLNVLEKYWDSMLIYDTYSCRKGKGTHKGSRRCMSFVRSYKYVLKGDISKFYPSMDHAVLKRLLERKLKDKKVLALLFEIIDSANTCENAVAGKNVPIGNLLSQWFGNLYFGVFDKYIKETLKIKAYIRYCDDFVIFSNDKAQLDRLRKDIEYFLQTELKLTLSKQSVFPVAHGVDYLGYRHFPDKIILRKRICKKWRRFFRKLQCPPTLKNIRQLASFNGITRWAQSFNFRKSVGYACA